MAAKRASGTLAVAWFSCKSFHNNIQSLATGSGGESVAYVTPKGAACSPTSNAAPSFPNEPEDPNVAKALREFCHQQGYGLNTTFADLTALEQRRVRDMARKLANQEGGQK